MNRSSAAWAAFVALALNGCYTTTNVATFTPLHTRYPVSASSQYVAENGDIIGPRQYQVLRPFKFSRSVAGKVHAATDTRLAIEPELDSIVEQVQADAVIDVKVAAVDYDHGSHFAAASWKLAGWSLGISGASCALVSAIAPTYPDGSSDSSTLLAMGGIFLGIGAVSYLIGMTNDAPPQWQFEVTGHVVRQTTVSTAEPIPSPPASPRTVTVKRPSGS